MGLTVTVILSVQTTPAIVWLTIYVVVWFGEIKIVDVVSPVDHKRLLSKHESIDSYNSKVNEPELSPKQQSEKSKFTIPSLLSI